MLTLSEAARRPVTEVGQDTHRLAAQGTAGMLVPAAFEEAYYLGVNLPEQLARLFAPVNPQRIDEDLLDGLCEQAQALVRGSSLSDDAVQLFYRALKNAGLDSGPLELRRPDEPQREAAQVRPPARRRCTRSSGCGRRTGRLTRSSQDWTTPGASA
ncbi:hypothetical protein ACXXDK_13225 [Deinococcus sp. PESE-38]